MMFKILDSGFQAEITQLFTQVFSDSEGIQEGELIGQLVSELSEHIDNQDIICFGTLDNDALIGVIFFSSLRINGSIVAYMLAPVAVATAHQTKGVGQALINHGLQKLQPYSVDTVVTYGDLAFYSKVGFQTLSEDVLPAPLTLSMPEGWLGLSLSNNPIPRVFDRTVCVKAFNNPIYW